MRSLLLLPIAALLAAPLSAQSAPPSAPAADQGGVGDLLVAPTRLVIEGAQKVAEVVVSNTGNAPGTYRISLIRMDMLPNGDLKEVPAPPAGTLDPISLFRYSPHQVVLQPGETQVVRIAARKPADLPDGEYHVHLQFMGLPKVSAPKPKDATPRKGFTTTIESVFGVSIPLVLLQGKITATASLSGLAFNPALDGHPALQLHLDRAGNASIYGDLKVFFTPAGGAPLPVGETNGIAVYPSLATRPVSITLEAPKGVAFRHGVFAVSFLDEKLHTTLAAATLAVP